LIDHAAVLAQAMLDNGADPNPKSLVRSVIALLNDLRDKTQTHRLAPPDGVMTLGLTRYVSNWIDELGCALSVAIGKIEIFYPSAL
jgi:hypothetical protein